MFLKCLILLFFSSIIEAEYPYNPYYHNSCPLPHLNNGRVRVRQRSKLIKFMCLPRYELVGNRYATCKNGEWDVPVPVCVKDGCQSFAVQNGVQIKGHHDAWVVVFCMPGFKRVGSGSLYCNGYTWNATIPKCIDSTTPPSYSCDFEEPDICGWTQDEMHDFDWMRINTKTPSSILATGPSYDHTLGKGKRGYYMYIESTSRLENNTARLLSPIYDKSLASTGCFSFFYHMYGQGTGGLRVYQKPDSVQMSDILSVSDTERDKYMIWEQWGDLGDFWYSTAPSLNYVNESFQIVIEGVRGKSFTSDIAIDDVALLQGINCTYFRRAATSPAPTILEQTCTDRCESGSPSSGMKKYGCECYPGCEDDDNCCPDYFETCVFGKSYSTLDVDVESNTPEEHPQTEKLVGETTTTQVITSTTPRATTESTTTATIKPTAIQKTATPPQSTIRMINTTFRPSTQTKVLSTTVEVPTSTTTKEPAKSTKIINTITSKGPTQPIPTPASLPSKPTTLITPSTTDLTNSQKAVEEKKIEKERHVQELVGDKPEEKKSSSWKTAVITIVILTAFASLIYLGVMSRTARGRVAIARLRGRTVTSDPEVRYLSSNDDDDL